MHHYEDLIVIFHACFRAEYHTQLVKGGSEPIYLPAEEQGDCHTLYFAHGFFSSALHECSHWLIAGADRRKLVDFGYWYVLEGRTAEQQVLFQQVEVKPQAMEWILSKAAGHKFRVSMDNLNGEEADTDSFKEAVYAQVRHYCAVGLPPRAQKFRDAISSFYSQDPVLNLQDFSLEELGGYSR